MYRALPGRWPEPETGGEPGPAAQSARRTRSGRNTVWVWWSIVLCLAALTVAVEDARAQYRKKVIMVSGQEAPGTGGAIFDSYAVPLPVCMAETGQVLFKGYLELDVGGVTYEDNMGFWVHEGDSLRPVARMGSPVPGLPGMIFLKGSELYLNATMDRGGQIGLDAHYSPDGTSVDEEHGFFMEEGGQLVLRVYRGLEVAAGVTVTTFVAGAFNNGRVVFSCFLEGAGVDNTNNRAYCLYGPEGVTILARYREPMHLIGGSWINHNISMYNDTMPLTSEGATIFQIWGYNVDLGQSMGAVYEWNPSSGYSLLRTSNVDSSLTSVFGEWRMDSRGYWMSAPLQEWPNTFRIDDFEDSVVAADGDVAAGTGGATFGSYGPHSFAAVDTMKVAFNMLPSDNRRGIWIGDRYSLRKVVQEGDWVPGATDSVQFGDVVEWMPNALGQIAVASTLPSPPYFTYVAGIWMFNLDGSVEPITVLGESIRVAPDDTRTILRLRPGLGLRSGVDGYPSTLNNAGQLAFAVTCSEGGTGVVVANSLIVNSVADTPDVDSTDGRCSTGELTALGTPECALRAAIMEANYGSGYDTIRFNIQPAVEPAALSGLAEDAPIIRCNAPLIPLTKRGTCIDATSQYGGRVEIDGSGVEDGLPPFDKTHGLIVSAPGCTVKGLRIINFSGNGLHILRDSATIEDNQIGLVPGDPPDVDRGNRGDGLFIWEGSRGHRLKKNTISGNHGNGINIQGTETALVRDVLIVANHIGTGTAGTVAIPNRMNGILAVHTREVAITDEDESGSLLGGNVISGNDSSGVAFRSSDTAYVLASFIGTNGGATSALGNGRHGVFLLASSVVAVDTNVIGGNDSAGIAIFDTLSHHCEITRNFIGTNPDEMIDLANNVGLHIHNGRHSKVGLWWSDVAGNYVYEETQNVISANRGAGVAVTGNHSYGNTIRYNAIYDNGGLGIDLGAEWVTANDLGNGVNNMDADTGPNGLKNFPMGVTYGQEPGNPLNIVITGWLHTVRPTTDTVDYYAVEKVHDSGYGGGQRHLGTGVANSHGFFSDTIPLADLLPFHFVSATATDSAGSTSEFSAVCGDPDGDGSIDSDGDGLCDDWERFGIDYDGDRDFDLDLPALGAKWNHKDLFLEVDWMEEGGTGHGHRPLQASLDAVVQAFGKAPVTNPDAVDGITLHAGLSDSVPHHQYLRIFGALHGTVTGGTWEWFDSLKYGKPYDPCGQIAGGNDGHFGNPSDDRRDANRCPAIIGARKLVYRYCILGHDHAHSPGTSGRAEPSGNDFMVTLGNAANNNNVLAHQSGLPVAAVGLPGGRAFAVTTLESGVLMHEFGHTLGLLHGGGDNNNYKPNYISVMNYYFQWRSVIVNRDLDYSRQPLPPLNENGGLQEMLGFGAVYLMSTGEIAMTAYSTPTPALGGGFLSRVVRASPEMVDWNLADSDGDGIPFNDPNVRADINDPRGTDRPTEFRMLMGHNDWQNLVYDFRTGNAYADGAIIPDIDLDPEITFEEANWLAETSDFDDDGYSNATDNCPTVYNPDQEDTNGDGVGDACEKCCTDRVGDANGIGGDEPSIGDVAVLIDAKYISMSCDGLIPCLAEADINQSGGAVPTCDDISIGDISILIDYLFISQNPALLPECL